MDVNQHFYCLRSNQSLKLTEPAVDDLAARCWTDLVASDWNVRATNYFAAAVRRRQLSAGPLGCHLSLLLGGQSTGKRFSRSAESEQRTD